MEGRSVRTMCQVSLMRVVPSPRDTTLPPSTGPASFSCYTTGLYRLPGVLPGSFDAKRASRAHRRGSFTAADPFTDKKPRLEWPQDLARTIMVLSGLTSVSLQSSAWNSLSVEQLTRWTKHGLEGFCNTLSSDISRTTTPDC